MTPQANNSVRLYLQRPAFLQLIILHEKTKILNENTRHTFDLAALSGGRNQIKISWGTIYRNLADFSKMVQRSAKERWQR